MKTLIVALNSKYIHSSLAPWYLKACCGLECGEVKVMEFTINESLDSIMASIYRQKADYVAFSCYIWNIGHVLKLAGSLKKVQPELGIILGGPEVSYDSTEILSRNESIDYVISGEGEFSFKKLLTYLYDNGTDTFSPVDIGGLSYRSRDGIRVYRQDSPAADLNSVSSPYTDEMLAAAHNRIVYFESSRGCPFSCTFCLSSTVEGVRFFPMERVKLELSRLFKARVRQVKFVDRTFNCHRERAKEIFRYIIELYVKNLKCEEEMINFHFEAAADLFDEEMLQILVNAPVGLIQLEMGVQSVNLRTLRAVNRRTSLDDVFSNFRRLKEKQNIHLHLDLIAGLPFEDMKSFKTSFNLVYGLKPHQLQLGFLKFLKGSEIRENSEAYGYRFRDYPPYEILSGEFLGFDELAVLKGIEELVEKYYNSGRFMRTLEYIISGYFKSAFDFFHDFYCYNLDKGYMDPGMAAKELYAVLLEYVAAFASPDGLHAAAEFMKLDFLASDKSGCLPPAFKRLTYEGFHDKCFAFLKNTGNLEHYLPDFIGIPAKQIFKRVHFELLCLDDKIIFNPNEPAVFLFNYDKRSSVTKLYQFCKVNSFSLR